MKIIIILLIFSHIAELTAWLNHKLNEPLESKESSTHQKHVLPTPEAGCLGPEVKLLDAKDDSYLVHISNDKLTVQSQTAFATVKANCCVFKGKWMYEVNALAHIETPMMVKFIPRILGSTSV